MMMTVAQIESAIRELPSNEFRTLAQWFEEFEAIAWDDQIKADLESGRLKGLIEEAEFDFAEEECRPI